jgi:hypothetical protein
LTISRFWCREQRKRAVITPPAPAGRCSDGVGPTAIGNIGDLDSPNTVKAIAAAYLSAFSQDAKAYPYLVG